MNVTAIIPVYNEEKLIGQCIDSIYDHVTEIVIVDGSANGVSKDKTAEIVKAYDNVVYLPGTYGHDGIWNKEMQINAGLKAATGDYIMPLSADMVLSGNPAKTFPPDGDMRIYSCLRLEFWLNARHARISDGVVQATPLFYYREGLLYTRQNGWHYADEFVIEDESAFIVGLMLYHIGWIRPFKEQVEKHIRNLKAGAWGEFGDKVLELKERGIEAWAISHVLRYKNQKGLSVCANIRDDVLKMRYDEGFTEFQEVYHKKYDEDVYSAVIRLVPPDLVR